MVRRDSFEKEEWDAFKTLKQREESLTPVFKVPVAREQTDCFLAPDDCRQAGGGHDRAEVDGILDPLHNVLELPVQGSHLALALALTLEVLLLKTAGQK